MGLMAGDIERVPSSMNVSECYKRIYEWHKKNGKSKLISKIKVDGGYGETYLSLLKVIPHPASATIGDMNFIFYQVIGNLMEWSYHEADSFEIKIAAYAHYALNKQFVKGFHDDLGRKSMESSSLFARFYGSTGGGDITPEYDQESIGIVLVDNRIRLVSVTKDGACSFVDGTDRTHRILYVASAEALETHDLISTTVTDGSSGLSVISSIMSITRRLQSIIVAEHGLHGA